MEDVFKWPPLESDPEIFNKYLKSIGLPNNIQFEEIYSLDYQEIQVINEPVIGVIAALQRTSKERYFVKENIMDENYVEFYMKQTDNLDNACGLIAALHVIGNNKDFICFEENSIIENYFLSSKDKLPIERALLLEGFKEFKESHSKNANEGQSKLCSQQSQVKHHYSGFIFNNGKLVELDGRLAGPHLIKSDSLSLIDDSIEEIKNRLMKGVISEKINLIYLYVKYD